MNNDHNLNNKNKEIFLFRINLNTYLDFYQFYHIK